MKRLGRPRKGKQKKEHVSIRLEPRDKKLLIKAYGSIQRFVDYYLNQILRFEREKLND